jgi:Regulator of ribonuclease activity B/Family of unknown function (DUF695)
MQSLKRVLRAVSSVFLAGAVSTQAETLPYPDQWESYFGNRGGQVALMLYNVGIGEVLSSLREKDCLIVSFDLKEPSPEGLPQSDEGKVLFSLDDAFSALISSYKAHDLGRVSTAGKRGLYIAAGENAEVLGQALVDEAAKLGYSAKFRIELGALADAYRYVLSPTSDERRLLNDQKVLRQLAENGDIATKVRKVDHWAYFPTRQAADEFAKWAEENGYSNVEVAAAEDANLPFVVRSSHDGTMLPDDISRHALELHQKAQALNGTYDGWETAVIR